MVQLSAYITGGRQEKPIIQLGHCICIKTRGGIYGKILLYSKVVVKGPSQEVNVAVNPKSCHIIDLSPKDADSVKTLWASPLLTPPIGKSNQLSAATLLGHEFCARIKLKICQCLKRHQHCIVGLKDTTNLLHCWILSIGGVASGRVCT